jgi:hypothetical protein
MRPKRIITCIAGGFSGLIIVAALTSADIQNGGGAPSARTGSPGDGGNCTGCHTGTAVTTAGLITTNIPANGYVPGTVYTITATVSDPLKNKFGFEVSPQSITGTKLGTLTITDATRTQLIGSGKYVTHKSTGTAGTSNAATWSFNWTAPAAGTGQVGFYGAFLAANANAATSGDVVSLSSLFVNENLSTGAAESFFGDLQIFPNPAVEELFVSVPQSMKQELRIRIFSMKGDLVKEESFSSVVEKVSIDVSALAEGMYFAEINWGEDKIVKRFLKNK